MVAKSEKRSVDAKKAPAKKAPAKVSGFKTAPLRQPAAPNVVFDINNPELPEHIAQAARGSGGFPYVTKLKRKDYEAQLLALQLELLKLQSHLETSRDRVVIVFEGRDTSGKGGCISTFLERMNPRHARSVALSKPSEVERGQWYFQRYAAHLPTKGDIVFFDRSWYNRAGVERVMGFCSESDVAVFKKSAPEFEGLLVREGIKLFKFYLTVGREMQLKRFHERRFDPMKQWKMTEIDVAAIGKWDEYSVAEHEMMAATHSEHAPWIAVHANDQKRARLETMRLVLSGLDYAGKDAAALAYRTRLSRDQGPKRWLVGKPRRPQFTPPKRISITTIEPLIHVKSR